MKTSVLVFGLPYWLKPFLLFPIQLLYHGWNAGTRTLNNGVTIRRDTNFTTLQYGADEGNRTLVLRQTTGNNSRYTTSAYGVTEENRTPV